MLYVALLAEGVDRNQLHPCAPVLSLASPSSRRAWIEMPSRSLGSYLLSVALLAEGVDRNSLCKDGDVAHYTVALLAEGVDRNQIGVDFGLLVNWSPSSRRAWIEIPDFCGLGNALVSPSSRRAWIEILWLLLGFVVALVALLAEGVDRNHDYFTSALPSPQSPSSRRAWIEIATSAKSWLCWTRSPSSRRAWIEIA